MELSATREMAKARETLAVLAARVVRVKALVEMIVKALAKVLVGTEQPLVKVEAPME